MSKENVERKVPEEYDKAMNDLRSKLQELFKCELRVETSVDKMDSIPQCIMSVVESPNGNTYREPMYPLLSITHDYFDANPRSSNVVVNLNEIPGVKIHMSAIHIPFTNTEKLTKKISEIIKGALPSDSQPVHIEFLHQGGHLTRLKRG